MRAPVGCGPEGVDHRLDRSLHDVVGQHHQHRVAVDESGRQPEGLGDAAGPVLVAVAEPVDAELVAVAQQPEELAGVGAPGDQHDLGDPGVHQRLDAPVDHRPVVDRQQVLVGDPGERMEPRAGPTGEDDALHRRSLTGIDQTGQGEPARSAPRTSGARRRRTRASTASASAGQDRAAHGPKGRSARPAQSTPGHRVDPEEGAGAAEVPEGGRRVGGARSSAAACAPRISTPRPQSQGSKRPNPGSTPARPGELDRGGGPVGRRS